MLELNGFALHHWNAAETLVVPCNEPSSVLSELGVLGSVSSLLTEMAQ